MNPAAFSSPSDRTQHRKVSIRRRGAVSETATSCAADEALAQFVELRRRRHRYGTGPAPSRSFAGFAVADALAASIARFGLTNWGLRVIVLGLIVAGLAYSVISFYRGSHRVPLHPVSARVVVGHTVPVGARVVLHPRSGPLPGDAMPQGTVAEDGSVTFVTYPPLPGVPAGDYVATVQWFRVAADGSVGGNVVPARYTSSVQSPLTMHVSADGLEPHVLKVEVR